MLLVVTCIASICLLLVTQQLVALSDANVDTVFNSPRFQAVLDRAAHTYASGRKAVAISVVADAYPNSDPGAEPHSLALLHNHYVHTWAPRSGVQDLVAVVGAGGCSRAHVRSFAGRIHCFELPRSAAQTRGSLKLAAKFAALCMGFDVLMVDVDVIATGTAAAMDPLSQLLSLRKGREDALLPVSGDACVCDLVTFHVVFCVPPLQPQDEPQRDSASASHMWFATPTSKIILAEALRASRFGGATADMALATAVSQWDKNGILQVARHRFMKERPREAGGAWLLWHNSEGTSRDQQVHRFREHLLWMVDEDGWYSNPEGTVSLPPPLRVRTNTASHTL